MIKPQKLNPGDKVAIVSLSNGMAGDKEYKHRYDLGVKRLKEVFGLEVVNMTNTLKGSKYLSNHPEARAKDFMDAFKDKSIKAVISNIGGVDSIRLLPYIDFEVIKNNPKIFMGYSDSTSIHFMMYKAGVTSYYGPCVMGEFAENCEMHDYTIKYIKEVLFENKKNISIQSSDKWTSEFLDWNNEDNDNIRRKLNKEKHGYEVIQGSGTFEGELLGGCFDVFPMIIGTHIWPKKEEWKNKIMFIEMSEDNIPPEYVEYYFRNLIAQGIIDVIKGIIIGKPQGEQYYTEYKNVIKNMVQKEAKNKKLPILYNVNIGHNAPMCIFPIGQKIKVDLDKKSIVFIDKPMKD